MKTRDFRELHGQAVLVVTPENAHRNPPVGVRGTLLLRADPGAPARTMAEISVSLPDMFTERAREKIIALTDDDLEQLLRTNHHGGYVWVLKEDLNPSVRQR